LFTWTFRKGVIIPFAFLDGKNNIGFGLFDGNYLDVE